MSKISYSNFLFDLDGTLIDSKEVILKCIKNTLKHFDTNEENQNISQDLIGLSVSHIFSKCCGLSESDTKVAVKKYQEYYEKEKDLGVELYSGVVDLLKKLRKNNKKIYLATFKLQSLAVDILKKFNIAKYFDGIYGASEDSTESKSQIIRKAISENELEAEKTVMTGDKSQDILGARENHIDSVGVLYGYGNYEELSEAKATYIVKNVEELSKILTE